MSFLEFLVSKKLVELKDLPTIKEEASSITLEAALMKRGIDSKELLGLRGEFYGVPVRSLENQNVPFDILKYVPEESAVHYQIVPIGIKDGFLEMGILDPENMEARDALTFIASKANLPYKIFLITKDDFDRVVEVYKGLSGEVTKALSELETELSSEEEGDIEINNERQSTISRKSSEGTTIIEDAPVTKIVATILRYAVEGGASDVHVEPLVDKIRVRFRVDGVLNTSLILPQKVHLAVVARIKILCSMRLDEKRKPQDGSFHARIEGRGIDFRVSTFPVFYGEKVVMRILDQEKGVKQLEEIGLNEKTLKMVRNAISKPYGLILISGPTGSGKSTTLYSMMKEVDREENNVLSLEDPVEYNIDGISQSQVRPEIGYTFANGLRTTLRQDPDIIMVGEIRDKETAQLAIQAALTGHLVFSTIHTNTATGIIPRLIDMGVDPYLIPPTLVLGIAQRLVRKIYPGTGRKIPIEGSIKVAIEKEFADLPQKFKNEIPKTDEFLGIEASAECPSGTRGRMAVFELFEMDKDIENVILKNPVESEIYKVVREKGMITMKEDAIIKALNKEIPFEEVNKL